MKFKFQFFITVESKGSTKQNKIKQQQQQHKTKQNKIKNKRNPDCLSLLGCAVLFICCGLPFCLFVAVYL